MSDVARSRSWTGVALAAYVMAIPLGWPALFQLPGTAKLVVIGDLAFVVLALCVFRERRERLAPLRPGLALASTGLLASLSLAACLNGSGSRALPDLSRAAYSVAVLLLCAHVRLRSAEEPARWWILGGTLAGLLGLGGYVAAVGLGLGPNALAPANSRNIGDGFVRVASTLETNALVLLLHAALVTALVRLRPGRPAGQRRLLVAAIVVLAAATALTFSRGVAGLLVSLALLARRPESPPLLARARPALAASAVLAVVAVVVATWWAVFPVSARPGFPWVAPNPAPNAYRVIHVAALRMLVSRPLSGVGIGRFGDEIARHTTDGERQAAWPPVEPHEDLDPHSTWLGWAAEAGLIGLAGWLVLYGTIARGLWDPACRPSGAWAVLVGWLLDGFHVEIVHLKFTWAFLGLALASGPDAAGGSRGRQARDEGDEVPPARR